MALYNWETLLTSLHVSTRYISFTFPNISKTLLKPVSSRNRRGLMNPPCSLKLPRTQYLCEWIYFVRIVWLFFTKSKIVTYKNTNNWDWMQSITKSNEKYINCRCFVHKLNLYAPSRVLSRSPPRSSRDQWVWPIPCPCRPPRHPEIHYLLTWEDPPNS